MSEINMRISAYIPAIVRRHLEKQEVLPMPYTQEIKTVAMFADVSGFTAMTESLAARGPVGAECLGKHLNSYFEQMLRLISGAGGDVFKFAGDAMIVFWMENKFDVHENLIKRCIQCALRIQSHLHKAQLAPEVVLSVKMGIGFGGITIAHLGGMHDGGMNRIEYIAVGPSLVQAFSAEGFAQPGDVICSPECWNVINGSCAGTQVKNEKFYKIQKVTKPVKMVSRRPSLLRDDAQFQNRMRQYVPRAVWPYVNAREESWGSELRDVTVLFINLGFSEQDLAEMIDASGLQRLQDAFSAVQMCVYNYEGTINKFLIDDKGSTVIAAFGLPPVAHENDPIRGILASLSICAELSEQKLRASVGITSGTAFCGVVGHQGNRREYTILGDIVNLSARLMQRAKAEKGGVITDETTKEATHNVLHFEARPEIMVKGKNDSIKIHRPYPRMSTLIEYSLKSQKLPPESTKKDLKVAKVARPMENVMINMHEVQVQTAHERLSKMTSDSIASRVNDGDDNPALVLIKQSLLERCANMSHTTISGAFILEGEIGLGKTRLLHSIVASPDIGDCRVLWTAGNPFESKVKSRRYSSWTDLIRSAYREEPHTTRDTDAWTSFIEETLREGTSPKNEMLMRYAHELNDLLGTTFPPSENENNQNGDEDEIETWFYEMLDSQIRSSIRLAPEDDMRMSRMSCFDDTANDWGRLSEEEWYPKELDVKGILLLCIVYALTLESPTVLVIDNAMYIDDESWLLASTLAKCFTNSLLVIGTRPPFSGRGVHVSRSNFRRQLRALKRLPTTRTAVLEALAPLHTEKLALKILNVQKMPQELITLLVSRSQGNPKFLFEIIQDMLAQSEIIVDEKRRSCVTRAQESWSDKSSACFCFQCHGVLNASKDRHRCKCCGYIFCEACTPSACRRKLVGQSEDTEAVRHCLNCYAISRMRRPSLERNTPGLPLASRMLNTVSPKRRSHRLFNSSVQASPLKNRIALRPPPTVRSVLTAMLDSLTVSQRMILKTGSVIGSTFEQDVLRGAYPIEDHLVRLDRDLEELERMGMIRTVDICTEGGVRMASKDRTKYEFNHGFMVDVLRSQMLSGQMDKLFQRVADYREEREKVLRQAFYAKARHSLFHAQQRTIQAAHRRHHSSPVLGSAGISNIATHLRLKAGPVYVRKRSSVFSALRRQPCWKKRWAVLQNTRLILQYDETNGSQPDRCTVLYLEGASVSLTNAEIAGRANCFTVHLKKWMRGKHVLDQPRDFILHTSTGEETESWLYMIKYAMESIVENKKAFGLPGPEAESIFSRSG